MGLQQLQQFALVMEVAGKKLVVKTDAFRERAAKLRI
jgi:hypothetical protein